MREKWKKKREEVNRRGRVRKMKSMTNEGGKIKRKKGEKEQDMQHNQSTRRDGKTKSSKRDTDRIILFSEIWRNT